MNDLIDTSIESTIFTTIDDPIPSMGAVAGVDNLLLEDGFNLLLEDGCLIKLET